MKADWVKTRQTKYTAYATVYILVVFAVVGAVNFLANRYDKTYDSTSNKEFSLSDQTIKVVKGLKKDVRITYFDEQSRFPAARDVLDRYSSLSPSLHVDYVDPVKKPQQAKAAGYRRDVTILVDSGGPKKEEGKSLTEEEITGALIRSLKSGDRNACFLTGSGEHNIDDTDKGGYAAPKQALERNNYKTRTFSLLQGAAGVDAAPGKVAVPQDCTVLIVAGPQHDYVQPETDAIKAYVESGGHALFLLDPPLNMGRSATDENTTLVALLQTWGVTVNKDLALDTSGIGQVFGLGPEVPLVAAYESHPIVNQMKDAATAFPLSRTLDVKNGDKTTVTKLFATADNSFATSDLSSGTIKIDPKKDKKGPLTLAAAGTSSSWEAPSGAAIITSASMATATCSST
jgi:ABC-type uncharacterized transport system involved in gliding motility auxiliary subunit